MPGEDQVDGARREHLVVLLALGVRHRHDKVGALLAQELGLLPGGGDRRQELQVARARGARRAVEGGAGEPDAHAVERDDLAVAEARQRLAVGGAQVGGVEREFRLAHPLEEDLLAEIELVVAGRENVGADHVGERDDVLAAVEPRHQRGRQRVTGMREDHVAAVGFCLGALGLHDRGEPREAAAPLAVRHRLVAHDVDVVDQDEGHLGRLRGRRVGGEQRGKDQDGGEAAEEGHGRALLTCSRAAYHACNGRRYRVCWTA